MLLILWFGNFLIIIIKKISDNHGLIISELPKCATTPPMTITGIKTQQISSQNKKP